MRKMATWAAHFPNPFVGREPFAADKINQRLLKCPAGFVRLQSLATSNVKRVDDFTDDVQLQLIVGRISHPNRTRIFVPWQPRQFDLRQTPFSHHSINRAYLRRLTRSGTEDPVAPRLRFLGVTARRQSVEHKRRVAQPTKTIVPIAHAAELLGKRRGHRSHDPASRSIGESLECNQRADNVFPPFASIGAALGPVSPPIDCAAEFLYRISLHRRWPMGRKPGEREWNALASRNREIGDRTKIFPSQTHRCAQSKRVGPADGNYAVGYP